MVFLLSSHCKVQSPSCETTTVLCPWLPHIYMDSHSLRSVNTDQRILLPLCFIPFLLSFFLKSLRETGLHRRLWCVDVKIYIVVFLIGLKAGILYRDDDKPLARPGKKKVRKHVRNARDFNNIETRAVIKFPLPPPPPPLPPARQGTEGNSRHSDRNISLFPSWSG